MSRQTYNGLIESLESSITAVNAEKLDLNLRESITADLERTLDTVIRAVEPDGFFEVGAFEAGFSRRMRAAFPDAEIVALEANPRVHARFVDEVSAAGVDYLKLAADTELGEVRFFIPKTIAGREMPYTGRMGSLNQVAAQDSTLTEVTVQATTLDAISKRLAARRMCLWIDVEGAIDRVLGGAAETLSRTAIVYCELESSEFWKGQALAKDVIGRLQAQGFTLVARDCQKRFQFNALFLGPGLEDKPGILTAIDAYMARAEATLAII